MSEPRFSQPSDEVACNHAGVWKASLFAFDVWQIGLIWTYLIAGLRRVL